MQGTEKCDPKDRKRERALWLLVIAQAIRKGHFETARLGVKVHTKTDQFVT